MDPENHITFSDEARLITHLQKGEEDAFEYIFRKYHNGLYLFALNFLKDRYAAENVVEDFFCSLWENACRLSINTSLRGYLFKSVYNSCLKYLRHHKVEQNFLTELHFDLNHDTNYSLKSGLGQTEKNLISEELSDKINEAIDTLPPQRRKIFYLNRFHKKTYSEIADELAVSINTVKTQMARALKKLRIELQEYRFF